jgi:ankyrin repeat protein
MNHSLAGKCGCQLGLVTTKLGSISRSASCILAVVMALGLLPGVAIGGEPPPSANEQLREAATKGDLKQVKALLESGASPINATDRGLSALMAASLAGHLEITKLLIDKGADINAKDRDDWTVLIYGLRSRSFELVELLIAKGADVNTRGSDHDGRTALTEAVINETPSLARLLIDNGADVNAQGRYDWTPLMGATWKGNPELVKLFLDRGAEVNATTREGRTALMEAAARDHQLRIKERHGPPWGVYPSGERDLDVVKLLLKNGADANAKDKDGDTAMKRAQRRGATEIVELLRAHGAKE